MAKMIDQEYRMDQITDKFEKQLYEDQTVYFWSVLFRSLQNSYGLDYIREQLDFELPNSRAAFFNHQARQASSFTKAYKVSQLGKNPRAMNLSNYTGTQVEFLVDWFEILRRMNKTSDKDERYPFVHVRTQLMEVVNSDTKLSDAFTELTPEKNKTVALYNMKSKMMEKAQLYDG